MHWNSRARSLVEVMKIVAAVAIPLMVGLGATIRSADAQRMVCCPVLSQRTETSPAPGTTTVRGSSAGRLKRAVLLRRSIVESHESARGQDQGPARSACLILVTEDVSARVGWAFVRYKYLGPGLLLL